jgi:hypothetical protein
MKTTKSPKTKPITAGEFDAKFGAGEDISEYLDISSAQAFGPGENDALDLSPHKVNVDFPAWVVSALDREAGRLGVPRQSLIKVWIVERLEMA